MKKTAVKRGLCLIAVLALGILFLPAAAEEEAGAAETDLSGYTIASGNVAAVTFEDLTAPWSGTLLPFDWAAGDPAGENETMFVMRTETLFAPEKGTVEEVFAADGDDAAAVLQRYGALISMQGENADRIQATTAGTFLKKENKVLRVGETLYFKSDKSGHEEGSGRVIAVSGTGYTVEIQKGVFEMGETLNLFRKDDYSSDSKVGSGNVFRRDPVGLAGQGRIGSVLVRPGDAVSAGQPVMTFLGPDADPGAAPEIRTRRAGVVAQVAAAPGQQVWKGALLARIWHTDQLEVVAEVDEMDLEAVSVGTECPVILDMYPDRQLTGKVTEISGLGVTRQNAAYYQVHFALQETGLPLGASASVYLPKE